MAQRSDSPLIKHLTQTYGPETAKDWQRPPLVVLPGNGIDMRPFVDNEGGVEELRLPWQDVVFSCGDLCTRLFAGEMGETFIQWAREKPRKEEMKIDSTGRRVRMMGNERSRMLGQKWGQAVFPHVFVRVMEASVLVHEESGWDSLWFWTHHTLPPEQRAVLQAEASQWVCVFLWPLIQLQPGGALWWPGHPLSLSYHKTRRFRPGADDSRDYMLLHHEMPGKCPVCEDMYIHLVSGWVQYLVPGILRYLTQCNEYLTEIRPAPLKKPLPANQQKVHQAKPWLNESLPHYILLDPTRVAEYGHPSGVGALVGHHASPHPHTRRGHWAALKHEKFARNEDGSIKRVWRRQAWVGATEWTDNINQMYRVVLPQELPQTQPKLALVAAR